VDKKYERAELLASMEHLFMNKGIAEFAEIASKQFKNSVAVPTMVRSKVPKLVMITADGEKKDVRFFPPSFAPCTRGKKSLTRWLCATHVQVPIAQWTSGQLEEYAREMLPAH